MKAIKITPVSINRHGPPPSIHPPPRLPRLRPSSSTSTHQPRPATTPPPTRTARRDAYSARHLLAIRSPLPGHILPPVSPPFLSAAMDYVQAQMADHAAKAGTSPYVLPSLLLSPPLLLPQLTSVPAQPSPPPSTSSSSPSSPTPPTPPSSPAPPPNPATRPPLPPPSSKPTRPSPSSPSPANPAPSTSPSAAASSTSPAGGTSTAPADPMRTSPGGMPHVAWRAGASMRIC